MKIKFKRGYKYQVVEDYIEKVDIIGYTVEDDFYSLTPIGVLKIKKGYASDGPSGPSIDTPDFMRGAFKHDCFYEMIRKKQIPAHEKDFADEELRRDCIKDGMPEFRADYVFFAVRAFGSSASDPENKKKIYEAPEIVTWEPNLK